jgi:1-acyl-sn-glycerol-3-phosphate acyltransferase
MAWYAVNAASSLRFALQEAAIAVSNHVSYFEPFYFVAAGYAHVGKTQIIDTWYWRLPMAFLQTVAVTRERLDSTNAARQKIVAQCVSSAPPSPLPGGEGDL